MIVTIAAIVFLIITAPLWLPLLGALLAIAIPIMIVFIVIIFVIAMFA